MIEMIRIILLMLATLMSLVSCKTRKLEVKEEQHKEISSFQIHKENEQVNSTLIENQKDYNLTSFDFGYNVTLQSEDSTKPAVITEFRNGKPFRSLEVKNGTYSENKAVKDSSVNERYKVLETQINTLETIISQQNSELKELKQSDETTKIEMDKITNNFKYLLWFLLLIAVIWIAERSGLFGLFKRLLKKV